jgi:hypothetical protein
LLIEAKYFEMSRLTDILTKAEKQITADKIEQTFLNGTLLQLEQKKKLNEFYGNSNQQWILIYKASRNGFDANAFHTHCNNQGPTMTIIQSNNNYIFGGYTAIGWTSDGSYKNDPTAFLFTLTNPHNITPTKYPVNPANASKAVNHTSSYGPTFGSGHDLYIVNNSNSSNSSCAFPSGYFDITGKGNATFTGSNSFLVTDIEVFKLV